MDFAVDRELKQRSAVRIRLSIRSCGSSRLVSPCFIAWLIVVGALETPGSPRFSGFTNRKTTPCSHLWPKTKTMGRMAFIDHGKPLATRNAFFDHQLFFGAT